jgi:hypothetical protein
MFLSTEVLVFVASGGFHFMDHICFGIVNRLVGSMNKLVHHFLYTLFLFGLQNIMD